MVLNIGIDTDFLNHKSILITGGTGFIGSYLVRFFSSFNCNVHVIARVKTNTFRINSVKDKIFTHYIDLTDEVALIDQLNGLRADYILNFAEPSSKFFGTLSEFLKSQHNSIKIITKVLEYAKTVNAERVIHACSSTIYGSNHMKVASEETPYMPDTYRGLTKLMERNICHFYAKKYSLPVILARIFRAYGAYDHSDRLIETALVHSLKKKSLNTVSSSATRDYINLYDLTTCVIRMLALNIHPGEEFNVGSGISYTASEIVEKLNELLVDKITIIENSSELSAIDKTAKEADITKAKRILGWEPKVDITTGLQEILEWHNIPILNER